MVVILNDNGMSINASMGGIAQHLANRRLKPQYLWAKEIYRKIMRATRRDGSSTKGSIKSRRPSRPAFCPAKHV